MDTLNTCTYIYIYIYIYNLCVCVCVCVFVYICVYIYVSWRAWRWFKRVETCRPNIVFYVINMCFDCCYILCMYYINTSAWLLSICSTVTYITKHDISLSLFTDKFGFLVSRSRSPICKRFRSKSYESCRYLWSQSLLLSVPAFLPDLQEGVEQKLCLYLIPAHKSQGVLKSGDRGGHEQHCSRLAPIHDSMMTGRISK